MPVSSVEFSRSILYMESAFADFARHWLAAAYGSWMAPLHVQVCAANALCLRMDLAENEAVSWAIYDVQWEGEAPHLWEGKRQEVLGHSAMRDYVIHCASASAKTI